MTYLDHQRDTGSEGKDGGKDVRYDSCGLDSEMLLDRGKDYESQCQGRKSIWTM